MTSDTSAQAPKSSGVTPLAKLSRMLQSMSRSFPRAHLVTTRDGFGVWLDGETSMQVSYRGNWTSADMRDCLALFATWCVADPTRIMHQGEPLAGVSQMVRQESAQSSMRRG